MAAPLSRKTINKKSAVVDGVKWQIMNKQGCPVCGFKEITVLDDFNCTTFEICDSCGCESGVEYDQHSTEEHLKKIRLTWVAQDKCKWWGEDKDKSQDWNPYKQMELADIEKP